MKTNTIRCDACGSSESNMWSELTYWARDGIMCRHQKTIDVCIKCVVKVETALFGADKKGKSHEIRRQIRKR